MVFGDPPPPAEEWVHNAAENREGWARHLVEQVRAGRTIPIEQRVSRWGPFDDPLQVAAGGGHVCVLERAGTVLCWGLNNAGQLGDATRDSRRRPVTPSGLPPVRSITTGIGHTCAATCAGEVLCWGGTVGHGLRVARDGEEYEAAARPARVLGLTDVVDVAAGWYHTCAILEDGGASCWGRISWSDEGLAFDAARRVSGPTGLDRISGGEELACAVDRDVGDVWCWGGRSSYARRGAGVPDGVPGVHRLRGSFVDVAVGRSFTSALSRDGRLHGWGKLYSGIAHGLRQDRPGLLVGWPGDVGVVAVGERHICAMGVERRLQCRGRIEARPDEGVFPEFVVP